MRFGLLGSLVVEGDDGREVDVRGERLRTLLAALLTRPNTPVYRDALVDAIWGGAAPPAAAHALDALLSRLRAVLAPAGTPRVLTRAGGYLILLNRDELDVLRFEQALAKAHAAAAGGDVAGTAGALRQALAEWRGDAYGELAYAAFAEEAMRLEELRAAALEQLFECELRLDRHREVLADIERFVDAHPLRERARCSLMLALYRSGRQADALAAYRAGALLLGEQGLEPGDELHRLHLLVLRHDPELLRPDANGSSNDRPLTLYARNGNVALAYQVSGGGPFDVVYAPPFVTNVDLTWGVPTWAALLRRIGSFCRLIRFDKRGTGMSDRGGGVVELDVVADDLRAVMDAARSQEAAVIGASDAGALALAFAAAHADRVWALVLWGATARVRWAPDYPWGVSDGDIAGGVADSERIWTEPGQAEAFARALGAADVDELAALWRQSASPGAFRELARQSSEVDVRALLPRIDVPVLVLNRQDDGAVAAGSRYLAEHLPDARHVEFPGSEHVMFGATRDYEAITAEIEAFLTAAWRRRLDRAVRLAEA